MIGFLVTDTYGTRQFCWTWQDAVSWLPYCSQEAWIQSYWTGKFIAGRFQQAPK